jgi:hypothetical protein
MGVAETWRLTDHDEPKINGANRQSLVRCARFQANKDALKAPGLVK